MSLLASWTWSRTARAVDEALVEAAVPQAVLVAVVELGPLSRLLTHGAERTWLVAERPRTVRRGRGVSIRARAAALPFADDSVGGLVATGAGESAEWELLLGEWQRVVVDGGALVLVDRGVREEHTRRAMCAGLCDLAQRSTGRYVVTSGRVRKL